MLRFPRCRIAPRTAFWPSPAQCLGCAQRDPSARWRADGKPSPGRRVAIRAFLNSHTGYGQYAEWLGRGLETLGIAVCYSSIQTDEQFLPLSPTVRERLRRPLGEFWELVLAPPSTPLRPQKATVSYTMWETTRLPRGAVENLDRAEAIVVPSRWCAEILSANGVARPLFVVPPGVSPDEYAPNRPIPASLCRFGTSGRMLHGAPRKGIEQVVEAFLRAFPVETDVRLSIKIWPDCPLPPVDDPRVEVIRTPLSVRELADWYNSLTVYVSASRGEGFGMQPLQAMACERAVIATTYSGHGMYLDETVGYPVGFDVRPAEGYYQGMGHWGLPRLPSLVERMREVYEHRDTAAARGVVAGRRAREFTWNRTAESLKDALVEIGMLSPSAGSARQAAPLVQLSRPSEARGIPVAIMTVSRPEPYLEATLESFGRGAEATLVVGSTDTEYLEPHQSDRALRIVAPSADEFAPIAGRSVHERSNWNYGRCLRQGEKSKRLLIIEDDVRFARGWRPFFEAVVREIEQTHRDYVLALYKPDALPEGAAGRFVAIDPRAFYGTQAVLFAGRTRGEFANVLAQRGIERWDKPYDLLLADYILESGRTLLATVPSIVQHVGDRSTGQSPRFHRSFSFVDDLATLGTKRWADIPGWFDFPELYSRVVRGAGDGAVFVEVGCWLGRSVAFLGQEARASGKRLRIFAVEHGLGSTGNDAPVYRAALQENGGSIAGRLAENLHACGLGGIVTPLIATSTSAAERFADRSVDFVFLDGDHTYEAVTADLASWWPKVRPGGLLAGHDYGLTGVSRALREFFGRDNLADADCPQCWAIERRA